MKRLTKVFAETTHGTKGYEAVNKINTDTESIHNLSEIITTLGELEDILESWHIENLEELKTRLHDCQVYHLKNNSNETLIHNLKNELAELKQTQKQLAIRELEKLKENSWQLATDISQLIDYTELDKIIDNQIKQLKEGK